MIIINIKTYSLISYKNELRVKTSVTDWKARNMKLFSLHPTFIKIILFFLH